MGFVRLAPSHLRVSGRTCFDAQHAALSAATFTICSSVVVVLVYVWRLVLNARHPDQLQDVYYGVQISYMSTLGTHITLIALTSVLFIGIRQERCGLITPWVVANIAFMALEAVCCMYSNILRDHINKQRFDAVCRAEVSFFLFRATINGMGLWAVMRFVKNIRAGITYKDPEAIEL
ncbi:uncharacterized protein LOC123518374 isoform X1 [Portunus trituberculatus]|uniref:uncharacterized protein LOC123518374 isoform X1 n=1 Tax=Portunus trituberculatus TaxID=210409 RepID=UPI001E1CF572|nr:uncharacterized protein LOC123518374 isoform X1 [Portunus trituberculatus]